MESIEKDKAKRSSRITREQKQHLTEFMSTHQNFAQKKISPSFTNKDYQNLLQKLVNYLNSIGPPKTESQWLRAWIDLKMKARQAKAEPIKRKRRTGGEPSMDETLLSPTKEKILQAAGGCEMVEVIDNLEFGIPDDDNNDKKLMEQTERQTVALESIAQSFQELIKVLKNKDSF